MSIEGSIDSYDDGAIIAVSKRSISSYDDAITFVSDVAISSPIYYDRERADFNGFSWVPGVGIVITGSRDERDSE